MRRHQKYGKIIAVVHSHPNGEPFLSGADRQMQIQTGLPWILRLEAV
nr:Mov34/MPN/PAD-1 family protein [Neisseria subflava]